MASPYHNVTKRIQNVYIIKSNSKKILKIHSDMYTFHNISKKALKINRFFSTSRFRNHYDTLNVKRDCSAKEIRDSFIKLSKEHHPDLNKNLNAHEKFLEINEAYKILSNTESRRSYDLGLLPSDANRNVYYREWPSTDPWKDPIFYHNRDKSKNTQGDNNSYYGIKGVKKVSNFTIVIMCLIIATIGVSLQFLAIRKSFTMQRDHLIEKSRQAENSLKLIKDTAALNGNEVQLELLKMRFANRGRTE
ncbi:dnaJ-like protein 60 isoform X2 [Leptinotarsa decemlineata]|uniref:dnaJ-like protein 60 isoform X2 n=1 Tax=Leptinotarsa decemlineata TaxID=7539 RepID=UPI003D30D640